MIDKNYLRYTIGDPTDALKRAAGSSACNPVNRANRKPKTAPMAKDKRKSTGAGWRVNKTPARSIAKNVPKTATFLARLPEAAAALRAALAKPPRQTQKHGWQLDKIREVLPTVFPPDGRVPTNLALKVVEARLKPEFEKRGWKPVKVDSIARYLGRRKRSD